MQLQKPVKCTSMEVVYIGHKMKGTERDILAHEYTHIIERKYGAACGEAVETNAVNEGVADTFACFIQENGE